MVSTSYSPDHSTVTPPGFPQQNRPARLTREDRQALIEAVRLWHDAGCAVHPAKADGSKAAVSVKGGSPDLQPDVFPDTYHSGPLAGMPHPQAGRPNPEAGQHGYGWGRIASGDMPRLTVDQIAAHINSGRVDGIGIFCGVASGNLEMVEVEGRARDLLTAIREAAVRLDALHLLERLAAGCVEESPKGGLHFVLRVSDGPALGNVVLAARPSPDTPHGREVLAETRGQGGWFVCAPSAGRTHASGKPYRFVRGGPATIPTFTVAERDLLYRCFRAVDEMPVQLVDDQPQRPARERVDGELTPGDDFNQRARWEDILTGWTRGHVVGDRTHWIRPGKTHGTSATTTANVLCCFSTNVGLPVTDRKDSGNGLSKFATYAHLHHGGDFSAAARDLWQQGYGSRSLKPGGDQPVQIVEVVGGPAGEERTLTEWRQEVAAERAIAISRPGLHLDTSPTGSGKTRATIDALKRAESSLTVLPTHANCAERVAEMQQQGIPAVAFPEMTVDNCRNFDVASQAQRLGLVAGAAVCPTCDFKTGCPYRAGVAQALKAPHRVATHERLRLSERAAEGCSVVVVDEMPETVIAPTLVVPVSQITAVETLANAILHHWYSVAGPDEKAFAEAMLRVVAAVQGACKSATGPGRTAVDLPAVVDVPDGWQRVLMKSIRMVGVGRDLEAKALHLITRAAAGELTTFDIVTDITTRRVKQADGSVQVVSTPHHFLVGGWRPRLPADAAIILLDATGDRETLEALTGQTVEDHTPVGHLLPVHPVVQIPDDITRATSPKIVAGIVDAFLQLHPDVQRLGIIGHQPHIKAMMVQGLLGEAARSRVAKWCHFGEGPDRGSNEWHSTCDHLLILGTPRPNAGDHRRRLVQIGNFEAAAMVDGGWGVRHWQGVDTDGNPVVVAGYGYSDPAWQRAYEAHTRASLKQAIGRGRPILPDGRPVTVITNEPTGLPVGEPLKATPTAAREAADVVRSLLGGSGAVSAKSPISVSYREICGKPACRTRDAVDTLRAEFGINRRAAEQRLADALTMGLVIQPCRGWWSVDGATVGPAADADQATTTVVVEAPQPMPAIVSLPPQAVVITATGPADPVQPIKVKADPVPEATTTTCTITAPAAASPAFDGLMQEVEERAAIMEFDGGLPRDVAERLAREAVLGRDHREPATTETVGVDHISLHARSEPFVDQVLQRIPGRVSVIRSEEDPFTARPHAHQRPAEGRCVCGSDRWVDIPIHGGQSVRRDCARCDRFGGFVVWYGAGEKAVSPRGLPPPTATGAVLHTDRLSFFAHGLTPTLAAVG